MRAWLPAAPVVPPRGEPGPPHARGKTSAIKSRGPVQLGSSVSVFSPKALDLFCQWQNLLSTKTSKNPATFDTTFPEQKAFKNAHDDALREGYSSLLWRGVDFGLQNVKSGNIRWSAARLFLRTTCIHAPSMESMKKAQNLQCQEA